MKYLLYLTDKDPINNQHIQCETAQEAMKYRRKAENMGFKVRIERIERIKEEQK